VAQDFAGATVSLASRSISIEPDHGAEMKTLYSLTKGLVVLALIAVSPTTAFAVGPAAAPLIVEPVADVHPVASADSSTHLAYELLVVNQSAFAVAIDSLTVLDENGRSIAELDATQLGAISRQSLIAGSTSELQPSQSSFLFLDVTVPVGSDLPTGLSHRFVTSQTAPAEQGSINLGGLTVAPDTGVAPDVTFTSGPIAVGTEPTPVLVSPVHGDGWVVFRGCCDVMSSHRGNTGIYGGKVRVAERFAIDFVRLSESGRMITGPGNEVASYVYYGEKIYAVADGTVLSARNDEPTQVPGTLATGISDDAAGGNSVVLDIGGGRYAFYAHMQPGSVRVKVGDRVRAGDAIGLLGNSGKTVGPHLHFHITDNPSPLDADGMPFVFEAFDGQGVLTSDAFGLAMRGEVAPVVAGMLAGRHRNAMPVNGQVIGFGN
jgi:hypothetical protein